MKKLIVVLLIMLLVVGCGKKEEKEASKEETPKEEVLETSDVGEGKVALVNASGNTEKGDDVWIKYDKNAKVVQIGINYELDGKNETEIFIDNKLVETKQLGNGSGSLTLKSDEGHLDKGTHTVIFQQKDGDNIVFRKALQYEVKE